MRSLISIVTLVSVCLAVSGQPARGQMERRIGAGAEINYYFLDSDFFGMEDAWGIDFAFKYEISQSVFFDTRWGFLTSDQEGTRVSGLNYQLGILGVFPVLIPYRPYARAGFGIMSVNPVTVTPVDTFRPAQTTFYFIFGGGFTRSLKENITVDLGASVWVAPYHYRIYSFDRNKVDTLSAQFTHVTLSLGLTYIF